jgi:hypothetical protein
MPGDDPDRIRVFEGNNLSVAAASPRYLLAVKLLAARVDRDQDDIRALYGLCGPITAEEGMRLLETTYPSHLIAPRAPFCSKRCFRRGSAGHPDSSDRRRPIRRNRSWRPATWPRQTSGGRC